MNENLYALLQSRFPRDRAQTALETANGNCYSYATLEELTARYAGFIRELGVVPGDRIAVQVEKSPEALFLYLACLQSGAVYLPLNSAYQEGEIDYFLGDATPKVVVHQTKNEAWMSALSAKHAIAHRFTRPRTSKHAPPGTKMPGKPRQCWRLLVVSATIWRRFSIPRARRAAAKGR
jgi:malonyl-CoA/methylmalonyl-CoA synthetase